MNYIVKSGNGYVSNRRTLEMASVSNDHNVARLDADVMSYCIALNVVDRLNENGIESVIESVIDNTP